MRASRCENIVVRRMRCTPQLRLINVLLMGCLFLVSLAGTGCTFLLPPTRQETINLEHICAPVNAPSGNIIDQVDDSELEQYPGLALSHRAIELAKVINAQSILAQLAALKQAGEMHSLRFLELRQMLTDRLLLTLFEVSSITAEIVCERDRADQSADQMDAFDTAMVKRLTLLSIVVAGVASVVSGGIGLAGGATAVSDATEVAGGVVAALFGGSALFTTSKQPFRHERNLLKEVWDNPKTSRVFSPAIWRFLQRRHKDQPRTSQSEIIQAWRQEGRLGEAGSTGEQERIALIFGKGGTYAASELRARASMLETLEAHIQLMAEELELFLRELIQIQDYRTVSDSE